MPYHIFVDYAPCFFKRKHVMERHCWFLTFFTSSLIQLKREDHNWKTSTVMEPFSNCPQFRFESQTICNLRWRYGDFSVVFKLKPGLPHIETQILAEAKLSETFWKHMSPIMYKHKISVHVMKHMFLHARVKRSNRIPTSTSWPPYLFD